MTVSFISELLDKFTCEEDLEGEIYRCERCSQQFTYQAAKKRLLIAQCPDVSQL
jgi:ubiquitin C-terminal hydrolase